MVQQRPPQSLAAYDLDQMQSIIQLGWCLPLPVHDCEYPWETYPRHSLSVWWNHQSNSVTIQSVSNTKLPNFLVHVKSHLTKWPVWPVKWWHVWDLPGWRLGMGMTCIKSITNYGFDVDQPTSHVAIAFCDHKYFFPTLQWRHNEHVGISYHRRRFFSHPFVQVQIKEDIKAPRHWHLWEESISNQWIPLTKGQ